MAPTETRTSMGALSRWPRRLLLIATCIAVASTVAEGVAPGGWGRHGDVVQSVIGFGMNVIAFCLIGGVQALLARPGEANPWRTAGVWAMVLAYLGCIIDLVWTEGWTLAHNADMVPISFWFGLLMDAAFFLAALYTLGAYTVTWLRARRAPRRAASMAAPGVQLGAATLVPFLTAFGLLFAFPPSQHMVARNILMVACYALAALAVALGTVLQARGGRGAVTGRALLWIGAMVLLIGGVLDSFAATSVSGFNGYFPYSNVRVSGLGPFVLPAGVVALIAALGGTRLRRRSVRDVIPPFTRGDQGFVRPDS